MFLCVLLPGCASMRRNAPSPDLRPCTDGYAYTRDGWRLGVRHYRPEHPDPGKLPVILCHGLGLNATFWTITDDHLPAQLTAAGLRGLRLRHPGLGRKCQGWASTTGSTGSSARPRSAKGASRAGRWTTWSATTCPRFSTTWSANRPDPRQLGRPQPGRDDDLPLTSSSPPSPSGSPTSWAWDRRSSRRRRPQRDMLHANSGIRVLLHVASAGRLGRPLDLLPDAGDGE